jgi:hypothetical protein
MRLSSCSMIETMCAKLHRAQLALGSVVDSLWHHIVLAKSPHRIAQFATQPRVELPQVHHQEGIAFTDEHSGAARGWIATGNCIITLLLVSG